MAGYERLVEFTDAGPLRSAVFKFTIDEGDLLADLVDHTLKGEAVSYRPSDLIQLSRIQAALDAANAWIEGDAPVEYFDDEED